MRLLYFIVFSFLPLLITPSASAATTWLDIDEPKIVDHGHTPPPGSPNDRCVKDISFIMRPFNILQLQTEQSSRLCATQTNFGRMSGNKLTMSHASLAGSIVSPISAHDLVQPIPRSDNLLFLDSSAPEGVYAYLSKNFKDTVEPVKQSDGTLQYKTRDNIQPIRVMHAPGSPAVFRDMRFSDNGKWMLSDSPYIGMTRLNTETGETLIFATPMNYNIGLNPQFVLAISGNGRYAVLAERTYSIFRIYDLSTCKPTADPLKPQNCQSRDLAKPFQDITKNSGVTSLAFSTDSTIRITAKVADQHNLFTLTLAGHEESGLDYLATGDSFASGEGAYSYKPYTDVAQPFNKCHLSLVSYPFLVGLMQSFNSFDSVACSGARIHDIYGNNPYSGQASGKSESHYDTDIFTNLLAGHRRQIEYVDKVKPRVITTSIGGNDIGFGSIIASCIGPGTCYNTPQLQADLYFTIQNKVPELTLAYSALKQSAATGADVYVVGYPELAKPGGACGINVHFDNDELHRINWIIHTLNNALAHAANAAQVTYIDVANALHGHRLCEASSDNIAVNGLSAGNDKTFTLPLFKTGYQADFYLTGRESYHPNRLGHKLLADAISKQIRTKVPQSPSPVPTSPPAPQLTPHLLSYDQSPNQIVTHTGSSYTYTASSFAPNATVKASFQGQTYTITATDSGEVKQTFTTDQASTGFQEVVLAGANISGDDIKLIRLVYVALKNSGSCFVVPSSGSDSDKDGLDDACDGSIGKSPLQITKSAGGSSTLIIGNTREEPLTPPINVELSHSKASKLLGVASHKTPSITTANSPTSSQPPDIDNKRTRAITFSVVITISILAGIILSALRWHKHT